MVTVACTSGSAKGSELHCVKSHAGLRDLFRAAGYVADMLDVDERATLTVLDRYHGGPDSSIDAAMSAAVQIDLDAVVRVDMDAIERLLVNAQKRCPAPLDDRRALHVNVHRTRTALTTAMLDRIADVLAHVAWQLGENADFVGFADSAFDSPALVARIESRVESAVFSPASERSVAALGAALLPHEAVSPLRELSLGPSFTDQEVKSCLENCHLDTYTSRTGTSCSHGFPRSWPRELWSDASRENLNSVRVRWGRAPFCAIRPTSTRATT